MFANSYNPLLVAASLFVAILASYTALDMAGAVRNAVSLLGPDVVEAARMASEYPAEFLGLGHELGRIAPGYRANLVLMDHEFKVQRTWIEGAVSS